MAVPSSGALTLLGIAQERYYSTYGLVLLQVRLYMKILLMGEILADQE